MTEQQRIPSSTLDKYYRVAAPKEERGTGPKNEIRISQRSDRVGQYIMYAINLFLKDNEDSVIIKAAGNAAVKCVLVAEILRHRIPDLHQINRITQTEINDLYKPKEEGLDPVTITKILPVLEIKLTKKPTSQELNDASYQKPLPADQVEKVDLENPRPVRKFPQREGQDREYDDERPRRGGQGRGGRRGGNRYRRGGPRGGPRDEQRGNDDFYRQDAPKDFEPENFRRGAPQQKRDDRETGRREQGERRDDDYNRGGYRGDRGGQRDNRGERDNYQEDRGFRGGNRGYRGGNRGGYRGGYNDRRRDDYEDRRFDDKEDRGFRGGNRGYGGRRDDYEEKRYDDREERGDERPRGGFRGGRGGFRGGSGFRGGFRNRGGNF